MVSNKRAEPDPTSPPTPGTARGGDVEPPVEILADDDGDEEGPRHSAEALLFLSLAFTKAKADNLLRQAAALAFTTILSLIPLLAVVSFIGARTFLTVENPSGAPAIDQQQRLIQLFSQVLPYSEEAILKQLTTFLEHASTIGSFGFVVFLITTLSAFTEIEQSVNQIWNVTGKRTFRSRLLSFTLVLFWGPLLIGAAYSIMFYLRQQPLFERFDYALLITLTPSFFTIVGLTMLYWLVPATRVKFRCALIGGLFAAMLLELLRQGFGLYASRIPSLSIIYGSFGLVLLFMISVHLAWWIILLGNEVAYTLQYFRRLTEKRLSAAPLEGCWLGLAALTVIGKRFRQGQPITPRALLAEALQLRAEELVEMIQPLLEQRVLREAEGENEGYLLSCDPHDLRVSRVFRIYDQLHVEPLAKLPHDLAPELGKLHAMASDQRQQHFAEMTVAELIRSADST